MGINISTTNYVTLDHTHQRRVDTSLESNPTFQRLNGINVRHIFRRNQDGDPDRDGNPLVKAMKGMGQFNIIPMYRNQVMMRAEQVLQSFAPSIECDMIMPMPSGYPFAAEVAQLVCNVTGKPYLDPKFIRKRTVGEMLGQYDGNIPEGLTPSLSKAVKGQLYDWKKASAADATQSVSMKRIDPKIRMFFQPLALMEAAPDLTDARVLVVDDLMSSGASVRSVAAVLSTGTQCTVPEAICFLSGL